MNNVVINGNWVRLADTDTKEKCLLEVRNQQPKATGMQWQTTPICYGTFGNSFTEFMAPGIFYTCLFQGKKFTCLVPSRLNSNNYDNLLIQKT